MKDLWWRRCWSVCSSCPQWRPAVWLCIQCCCSDQTDCVRSQTALDSAPVWTYSSYDLNTSKKLEARSCITNKTDYYYDYYDDDDYCCCCIIISKNIILEFSKLTKRSRCSNCALSLINYECILVILVMYDD